MDEHAERRARSTAKEIASKIEERRISENTGHDDTHYKTSDHAKDNSFYRTHIIIVGAGSTGLSAAIYTARGGLNTAVFGR